MAFRSLMISVITVMLAGCTGSKGFIVAGTRIGLHAYEGPVANTYPGLVIKAVSRGQSREGTLSYELPSGTACEGKWSRVTNRTNVSQSTLASLQAGSGRIEKGGSFTSPSEGGRVFHALRGSEIFGTGTCNDGASFEFASIANGAQGRGALRDSNGNVFRIVYR